MLNIYMKFFMSYLLLNLSYFLVQYLYISQFST